MSTKPYSTTFLALRFSATHFVCWLSEALIFVIRCYELFKRNGFLKRSYVVRPSVFQHFLVVRFLAFYSIFHNLKNYNAHLIITKANKLNIKLNQNKRINVIAQNNEKFITFSFGACQFKNNFAFLTTSLDKLVRLNTYKRNQQIKN